MSQTTSTDFPDELHQAIRKLEEFAKSSKEISLTPIQKTIDIVRGFIFSNSREKRSRLDQEVLQAIEIIKRHRIIIKKLQNGTPAEQKLAQYFLKTIDGFNDTIENHQQSTTPGIAKFFVKEQPQNLSKIDLSHSTTVQQHYPDSSEWKNRKIVAPLFMKDIHLSKQSTELFQMKVIALLERYGLASSPEARTAVKSTPIIPSIEEDQSRCTLTQTITLFPGQTIVVQGSSELNPQTSTISKLFPETFSLLLQSTQTGFPHPSQRHGWTLANPLIPEAPQRPDLLSSLFSFFQNKKEAIQKLLPKGIWEAKAKAMIKFKREVFNKDISSFISFHRQLTEALLKAAPQRLLSGKEKEAINFFYDSLEKHSSPFDFLSETNQMMMDTYVGRPHAKLMEAILAGNISHSYETADKILTDEIITVIQEYAASLMQVVTPFQKAQLDYIKAIGPILGHSSKAVMLQYLSEDLLFSPPALNEFEKKLQAIAYQQVEDFLQNLATDWNDHPNMETVSSEMKNQIQSDINRLNANETLSVVDELAEYFKSRYLSH